MTSCSCCDQKISRVSGCDLAAAVGDEMLVPSNLGRGARCKGDRSTGPSRDERSCLSSEDPGPLVYHL